MVIFSLKNAKNVYEFCNISKGSGEEEEEEEEDW
jgi:hypothetical protein